MSRNKTAKQRRKIYTAQFYRRNRLPFALAILSTMLISSLNLLLTWLMQQMIDTVSGIPGAYSLGTLTLFTAGTIGLILLFKALSYISLPRFMENAMRQFKAFVFEQLTRKSIGSFNRESTAHYISALSNDTASIESNYLEKQFSLISNIVLSSGAIVMMLVYNPLLTIVAMAFFILPIVASLIAGNRMEQAEKQVSEKNSSLIDTLKDCLSGFSVIKSFRAEETIKGIFAKSNTQAESAKCARRKLSTVMGTIGSIAGVTAQFGTLLVGGYLALSGLGITPGVLIIFMDLTASVINPIRDLPELYASRKAARGLIDKTAQALETNIRDEGENVPAKLNRGITFDHVSFSYENEAPVLRDIHFQFEAGKRYAIVGASGSGKSTLLNLLMAAHDSYAGTIGYDDTELRRISSDSLYGLVSLIQQNVFVFNATIRDNITMFRDLPADEVDRAIRLSGLRDLIDQRGDDYLCGENGSNLSGGEKQRISIARSLLRKSSVLLVDEATASLDAQTAYQVTKAILDLDGLTRIIITHALDEALLRQYDCILTLRSGHIVESGTFDQLMERKGYFHSLYTVSQ